MPEKIHPLRGRSRELCLLDEIARRTARGESLIGHVRGPAGVGKTALLDTWTSRLKGSIAVHRLAARPLDTARSPRVSEMLLAAARDRDPSRQAVGLLSPSTQVGEREAHTARAQDSASRDASYRRQLADAVTGRILDAKPTLLIFEDTHWAESSLRQLLTDICLSDSNALSVILAYRDGGPGPVPALAPEGRALTVLVGPLHQPHARAVVADRTGQAVDEALTDQIIEATGGLPLAIVHAADQLRRGVPSAEIGVGQASTALYDLARTSLSPDGAAFVQVGALLSDDFDEGTAAACLGWPTKRAITAAIEAQDAAVLAKTDGGMLAFTHDELQASALAAASDGIATLRVASAMNLQARRPELAFRAAHLLLAGAAALTPADVARTTQLWLQAGQGALGTGNFELAHEFLVAAWDLMLQHDHVAPDGLRGISEASWLVGDVAATGQVLRFAEERSVPAATYYDLTYFHVRSLAANDRFDEAIDVALRVMAGAGITFPASPQERHAIVPFLKVMGQLRKVDPELLADLPAAGAEESSLQRLMAGALALAYAERPGLFPLIAFAGVRRISTHGVSSFAPVSLIGFATVAAVGGKHALAQRWGQASLQLASKDGFEQSLPWTMMQYYDFVYHWHGVSHHALGPLAEAFEGALEHADVHTAGLIANVWTSTAFMTGHPLDQVDENLSHMLHRLTTDGVVVRMAKMTRQLVRALQGQVSEYKPADPAHDDQLTVTVNEICDHAVEFFIGDEQKAAEKARRVAELLDGVRGTANIAGFRLTLALTLAQAEVDKSELKPVLKKSIREFKTWVKHSPDNYTPGLRLLQAEQARIDGRKAEALDHYQATIVASEGSVHQLMTAALAKTRAGDLEFRAGRVDSARGWFDAAERAWQRIGAFGVAQRMRSRYVLPAATRSRSGIAETVQQNQQLLARALSTVVDALSADAASIIESVDDVSVVWLDHRRVVRLDGLPAKKLLAPIGSSGLSLAVEVDQTSEVDIGDSASIAGYATLASVLAPTRAVATRPVSRVSLEEFVRRLFGAGAERVLRGGIAESELTVLSIDIVNYTGRIEAIGPSRGVAFLSRYLDAMIEPIMEHGGLAEPREGDAIMAMFPTAEGALRAALALPKALAAFNETLEDVAPVAYRAGMATGPVAVAMIESGGQPTVSHAGDVLNLAGRLCNVASQLDYDLLVDSSTLCRVESSEFDVLTEPVFGVTNRAEPVHCYQVFDAASTNEIAALNLAALEHELDAASRPLRQISKHGASA